MSNVESYFNLTPGSSTAYAAGQTGFLCWFGAYIGETVTLTRFPKCIVCRIVMNVATNTVNGDTTFTLRLNGATTGYNVTYAAGETGKKSTTVNIIIEEGDNLSMEMVIGGTAGGITPATGGVHYD